MEKTSRPVYDDTWIEPAVALKIGPFSCYCACVPRKAAPAGGAYWQDDDVSAADYVRTDPHLEVEPAPRRAGGAPRTPSAVSGTSHATSFVAAQADSAQDRRNSQPVVESSPVPRPRQESSLPAQPPAEPGAQPAASSSSARPAGHLAPVIQHFEAAVAYGENKEATELKRVPFVDGVQAYVNVLNKLGGNMGDYLETNVKKLRTSKADASEEEYKAWLFTELPTHGPKYQGYADESAWMGNLWIAWTLEFFVEFFAELKDGKETKGNQNAVELAYNRSLYHHHNWAQRQSWYFAMTKMPSRDEIFNLLKGEADMQDFVKEVADFVAVGRPVVKYLLDTNEALNTKLQEQKKKVGGW